LHEQCDCGTRVGCDLEPIASYGDVEYVRCDGTRLPFKNSCFDLCTAWDVLEHVHDDRTMLTEIARVLRPGGRARLSVPHKDISVFPPFLMPWINRRWQHSIRSGYTPSEIQSLAESANFATCRVEALKAQWFRSLYLVAALLWRVCRPAGRSLVAALARRDASGEEGPNGHLLVEMEKA